MALFKILRGNSADLTTVPLNDGYAYFTPDNGRFYIDVDFTHILDNNNQPAVPAHYVTVDSNNAHLYRIELRPSESGKADSLNPNTFGLLWVKNVSIDTSVTPNELVVVFGNGQDYRAELAYSLVQIKKWTSADVVS